MSNSQLSSANIKKVIVFGNSGSGKSTLAKKLQDDGLAHLDLDTIAWLPGSPPTRRPIEDSKKRLDTFVAQNTSWVIEGCYSDLLALAALSATEAVFMNLDVELCIENARKRPWEAHKYPSKQAQDENLNMLIEWISQYPHRADTFSKSAHESLFADFEGTKTMVTRNSPPL